MMYSIWLLPKKEDHELLGSVISRLSGTYNGKKFSPHLTAFGDISADPQLIEKATRDSITREERRLRRHPVAKHGSARGQWMRRHREARLAIRAERP